MDEKVYEVVDGVEKFSVNRMSQVIRVGECDAGSQIKVKYELKDNYGQPIYKKEARYFFENCNKTKQYLLRLDLNNNYGLTAYDDVGEINYYLIFDKNTSNIYLEEYY